jgi:murein DD-endopeptidase MepM/ murein hydrolase activator NlpD
VTNPVPGHNVTTPYGKRGSYWSCNEDSSGNGIHTGVDYAAPTGTKCVAARPGTVVHSNHGSAFGYHQVDIVCSDGTRDFYAHMRSRRAEGKIKAGEKVGEVGSEGNVTGPHLHFERHATQYGGWSCSVVRDPAPSINYQDSDSKPEPPPPEEDMPKFSRTRSTKPLKLKPNEWTSLTWDTISSGDAGKKDDWFITFKSKGPFTATLNAAITAEKGQIRTRFMERNKNSKGEWETTETYAGVEHTVTSGDTYVADTRVQNVGDSTRLLAQVNCSDGGTVKSADLSVLYF